MLIGKLIQDIEEEKDRNQYLLRLSTETDSRDRKVNELAWLKNIVAFSNTFGGRIYDGVDDTTHEIDPLSQEEVDKTIELLYQETGRRIKPKIKLYVRDIPLGKRYPDQYVLRIDIRKSGTRPVYVYENDIPVCYIREEDQAKIATIEQIESLVIASIKASYGSLPTEVPYEENKFTKLKQKYLEANPGKNFNIKVLESIGFVDDRGNLARGALLFQDDCKDPLTLAKCSQFPTFDKSGNIVTASVSYQGCLFDVIDKVMDFIRNHSTTGYQKTPTGNHLSRIPSGRKESGEREEHLFFVAQEKERTHLLCL